jgi:hypothetical protein
VTSHGKDTGVAIGSFELTRFLNEVSTNTSIDTAETSCFDEPAGAKTYTQGQTDGTGSFSGRYGGTPTAIENIVLGIQNEQDIANDGVGHPVTVGPDRGFRFGKAAIMAPSLSTSLNVSSPLSDVVSVSGDLQAEGGWRNGVVLSPKDAITATGSLGTVNIAAATQYGASGHLHVVQNTRGAASTFVVQHSSDGNVWVDLLTFDSVPAGAVSGQRKSTAGNVTVNRYLRVLATPGGATGSITVRVAVARAI